MKTITMSQEESKQLRWTLLEFRALSKHKQKARSLQAAYEKARRSYNKEMKSFLLKRAYSNEDLSQVTQMMAGDYISDISSIEILQEDTGFLKTLVDDWECQLHMSLDDLGVKG
jgi:transcription elongation GreA/GreB family factor